MKAEIIDKYWVQYLRYWRDHVKDESKPPTENDFWAWYVFNKLDIKPDVEISV